MKTVLVAWMLLVMPSIGLGCDVCGIFLGIRPYDRTSSISLLWRYRHLEGDVLVPATPSAVEKHGGHAPPSSTARTMHYRELYQVAELRADLWLHDRFALLVGLPVVNNYRAVDGVVSSDLYGVGDPLLIGRYQLVNTKCLTPDERVVHRIMLGAGVKVPLGRSDLTYEGRTVEADQQPGTGTWDLLGTAEYSVRYKRNGAAFTLVGRWNSANADGYQLGHGISTTAEGFHRFDINEDWKVMPSLGVYHELSGMDITNGVPDAGTGGSTLFTHVGSRVWWRSWAFSATFQYAVAYNLGELMIPNRERIVLGMTYNIIK
ncbi:MAG TPA: hypothetical protein PLB89_03450 [Flavobacteriales bacterium]|nr:hypothetical protein [Flavobacteriales bacterium]